MPQQIHETVDEPRRDSPSSIQRTLDLIGDRWTFLVLRAVFRGIRRFSQIQTDLGIAKNLLADRLGRLVDHDILVKVPYQDRPVRYEYRLTERGRDLSPALVALMHWGDRWCTEGGPPTVLVHDRCDAPVEHVVRCTACGDAIDPTEIRSRPGGSEPHADERRPGSRPSPDHAAPASAK